VLRNVTDKVEIYMDDLIVERRKENSQDGEEGENGAGEDLPLRLNFFETFIVHI